MVAFPNDKLNQKCIYWTATRDAYGTFSWSDPIELDCRWVEKTKLIMNNNGEQIVSMAFVQVNQDLEENGRLYLGELNDLDSSEEADPTTITDSYIIKRFIKTPDIKGNIYYRRAFL
jgi:hypothetical protein